MPCEKQLDGVVENASSVIGVLYPDVYATALPIDRPDLLNVKRVVRLGGSRKVFVAAHPGPIVQHQVQGVVVEVIDDVLRATTESELHFELVLRQNENCGLSAILN